MEPFGNWRMVLYERGPCGLPSARYKEEIGMDRLVSLGSRTCDTRWLTDIVFAEDGVDISMNTPNLSDPTFASGTSPAGQEASHR